MSSSCMGKELPKEKKWGVKDCRARKCPELQRDPKWPDSPERCMVFNSMPGSLPCCIKDPEMKPETLLRHIGFHLELEWENNLDVKNPGPKNCPEKCPYKFSEMGEVFKKDSKGVYGTHPGKITRCAFTGDKLGGGGGRCICHVLGNPEQDRHIETIKMAAIHRNGSPFERVACHVFGCPDGIIRCKAGDTICPVIKLPFIEIKECPLWRIPAKLLPPAAPEKPKSEQTPYQQIVKRPVKSCDDCKVTKDECGSKKFNDSACIRHRVPKEKKPSRKSSQEENPEPEKESVYCSVKYCENRGCKDLVPKPYPGPRCGKQILICNPLQKTPGNILKKKCPNNGPRTGRMMTEEEKDAADWRVKDALIEKESLPGGVLHEKSQKSTEKVLKKSSAKPKKVALILTDPLVKAIAKTRALRDKLLGEESGYFDDEELLMQGLMKLQEWYPQLAAKQKHKPKKAAGQAGLLDMVDFAELEVRKSEEPVADEDPCPQCPERKQCDNIDPRCDDCQSFDDCKTHNPGKEGCAGKALVRHECCGRGSPDHPLNDPAKQARAVELKAACLRCKVKDGCTTHDPYTNCKKIEAQKVEETKKCEALEPCSGPEVPGVCEACRECDVLDDCLRKDPYAGCRDAVLAINKAVQEKDTEETNPAEKTSDEGSRIEKPEPGTKKKRTTKRTDSETTHAESPKCPFKTILEMHEATRDIQQFSRISLNPLNDKVFVNSMTLKGVEKTDAPYKACQLAGIFCGTNCEAHGLSGKLLEPEKKPASGGPTPGTCGTCGHHKGKKTFHPSCPRLGELLFKGGPKSAKVLMQETERERCGHWMDKADRCQEINDLGNCIVNERCDRKTEEERALVGCTVPVKPIKPKRDTPEWFTALTEAKRRNNPGWSWEVWKHSEKGEWLYEGADTYQGAVDIKDRLDKTLPKSRPDKHSPVHFTLKPRPAPNYPAGSIEGPCKVCKIECIDENGADGCWEFEEHIAKLEGEDNEPKPERWGYKEICIISCGKAKIWDEPKKGKKKVPDRVCARNAYTGPLFTLAREFAEHKFEGQEYYILSDKYGLIRPGDEIENYDVSPEDIEHDPDFFDMVQQRAKADPDLAVLRKITTLCGAIHQGIIERAFPGVEIVNPVQGLTQGERMKALKALTSETDEAPICKDCSHREECSHHDPESYFCLLFHPETRRCKNCGSLDVCKFDNKPHEGCAEESNMTPVKKSRGRKPQYTITIKPVTEDETELVKLGRKYTVDCTGPHCGSSGSMATRDEVLTHIYRWIVRYRVSKTTLLISDSTGEFRSEDLFDVDGQPKPAPEEQPITERKSASKKSKKKEDPKP